MYLLGRHLEVFPNSNNPTRSCRPVPANKWCYSPWMPLQSRTVRSSRISRWSSIPRFRTSKLRNHLRQQFLSWAANQSGKTLRRRVELPGHLHVVKDASDAVDLLNGGAIRDTVLPDIVGAGIHYDYGLAEF